MDAHLRKHLIHGLFLLAFALAVRTAGIDLGAIAVVGIVVLTLGLLEAGLWLIHRREAARVEA